MFELNEFPTKYCATVLKKILEQVTEYVNLEVSSKPN